MLDPYDEEDFRDAVRDFERKRVGRLPKTARTVLQRMLSRTGYLQASFQDDLQGTWRRLVGEQLAERTHCGRLRGGTLEIIVADSVAMAELNFDRRRLLQQLQSQEQGRGIRQLRFRLGSIG